MMLLLTTTSVVVLAIAVMAHIVWSFHQEFRLDELRRDLEDLKKKMKKKPDVC